MSDEQRFTKDGDESSSQFHERAGLEPRKAFEDGRQVLPAFSVKDAICSHALALAPKKSEDVTYESCYKSLISFSLVIICLGLVFY